MLIILFDFACSKPFYKVETNLKRRLIQITVSSTQITDSVFQTKQVMKSAPDHIQLKIFEIAKDRVFDISKSISEIAYESGFKHPRQFSLMLKNETA